MYSINFRCTLIILHWIDHIDSIYSGWSEDRVMNIQRGFPAQFKLIGYKWCENLAVPKTPDDGVLDFSDGDKPSIG